MSKLITDDFVRKIASIMLISIAVLLLSICIGFGSVMVLRILGFLTAGSLYANEFVKLLTISFKSEFSPFITVAVGVFPAMVSAVCYDVEGVGSDRKVADNLNRTGHWFFCLVIVSMLAAVLNMLILSIADLRLLGDEAYGPVLKNFFTGILSFLAVYLVQLLGLKPK